MKNIEIYLNFFKFQFSKLKEGATKLREKLTNKDNESVEDIKQAADEFQRQSLKLFETAYKKVGEKRLP